MRRVIVQHAHRHHIHPDAWALAFVVVVMCLAALNLAHAAESTVVLNDTNAPPYTTPAGDGFFDIIATEAFRRTGLRLKLVKLPSERALMNANAGVEDGDLTRIAGLVSYLWTPPPE